MVPSLKCSLFNMLLILQKIYREYRKRFIEILKMYHIKQKFYVKYIELSIERLKINLHVGNFSLVIQLFYLSIYSDFSTINM